MKKYQNFHVYLRSGLRWNYSKKMEILPAYRHRCQYESKEVHQTNPIDLRDPLDAPLDPLGPPGRPPKSYWTH